MFEATAVTTDEQLGCVTCDTAGARPAITEQ